jgi:ATP/maltotriose-dependent transcriptional regulator MalT
MLDPNMMAEAARLQDLHLVVLAYRQRNFDPNDAETREVMQAGHASFRLMHEGYPLRSVWQEGELSDHEWMSAGGLRLKRTYLRDGQPWRLLCGTLREEVTAEWPSHTVSFLFQSREARLQLTPAQRRVAELALWGLNDEQVAQRLTISGETVRRHWRGIFERIEDRYPKLLAEAPHADDRTGRGPEKRKRVLELLRINLQEIRATA